MMMLQRNALNDPAGTTGCAPDSRPLVLAGGAYAVRSSTAGRFSGLAARCACGGGALLATVAGFGLSGAALLAGGTSGQGDAVATAFGFA
jgi:hypothetical protein